MRPEETGEAGRPDDDRRRQLDVEELYRLVALRRAGENFRRKLDRREGRLVASHGDLVARGAVDHVENHARKAPAGERAQRGDAVSLALQCRDVHQAFNR